jgi:hypothetical protein
MMALVIIEPIARTQTFGSAGRQTGDAAGQDPNLANCPAQNAELGQRSRVVGGYTAAVKLWSGAQDHGRPVVSGACTEGGQLENRKTSRLKPSSIGRTAKREDSTNTVLRFSRVSPKVR